MFKANRYSLRENVRSSKPANATNGTRRALGDISNNTTTNGVQNVTKKFSDLSANGSKRPSPPVENRANGSARPSSFNRVSPKQNWVDIDAADEITIDTTSADGHIAITSAHTAGDSILISTRELNYRISPRAQLPISNNR